MSEHVVRKSRVFFDDEIVEEFFIFHHRSESHVAPVAPAVVLDSGLAMTDVVIGGDDVAGFHKTRDHVEIAAGMLTETVNELNDPLWRAGRYVDPPVNEITPVERDEFHFMQHIDCPFGASLPDYFHYTAFRPFHP